MLLYIDLLPIDATSAIADELDGDSLTLMNHLEKRALGIGARFSEDYRARRFVHDPSSRIHRSSTITGSVEKRRVAMYKAA